MDSNSKSRPMPVRTTWRPMTSIQSGPRYRRGLGERKPLERTTKDQSERCKSAPQKYRPSKSPAPDVKTNFHVPRRLGWDSKSPPKCASPSLPRTSVFSASDPFEEEYDFDKWSDDEEKAEEMDPTLNYRKVYEAACRDLHLTPVESFARQMASNTTNVNLKNKLLIPKEVKAIAIVLVNNIIAQTLDLSGNELGPTGSSHITQVLKENSFLTEINLSSTNPGKQGLKVLSAAIRASSSLRVLNLSSNEFDIGHAPFLADIISNNDYLQTLDLSYNRLGDDGGQILGPAIGDNVSLTELNLKWNHLRMRGAIAVAKGIENNCRLEKVDLSWNGFGLEGSEAMAQTLANNQALVELSLACNRIDISALEKLTEGVIRNESLRVLRLGLNPMTTDGAMYLLEKLKDVQSSGITELDITDVPVDNKFHDLMTEIQSSRTLSVQHGMLFRVNDIRQEPQGPDFKHFDPLMILYHYMKEDNLRLIDVFRSFDVNKDDTLTRQEFRDGFLAVNIPMTEHGLDILLKKLDLNADGKVDFVELGEGHRQIKRKVSTLMHKLKEKKLLNPRSDDSEVDQPYIKLQGLVKEAVTARTASISSPRRNYTGKAKVGKLKGEFSAMPTLAEISDVTSNFDEANELECAAGDKELEEESHEDLLELANSLRQLFNKHRTGNTIRLVFKATSAFNQSSLGK